MNYLLGIKGCQMGVYIGLANLLPLLLVLAAAVHPSYGAALTEEVMEPMNLETEPLLHSVVMDPYGKYIMSWTPGIDDVTIEVQVEAQGYVGLGFSPMGGMKGADIVMGWVDEQGEAHLTDRYGVGDQTPIVDDSQDVTLISGRRNETHTTLRFRRPWNSCDKEHDLTITTDTQRVIYSYNDVTPDPTTQTLPYHTARGVKSIYVREPGAVLPDEVEDVEYWDVIAHNISLPSHLTTLYWCKMFKVPKMEQKQHYIGFKPLIAKESLPFVHHMILYECHLPDDSFEMEHMLDIAGAQCYTPNMPRSWNLCNTLMVGWGVGSEGGFLPDHVGVPLGEEYGSTYFRLEIHYNNPLKVEGIVDSSGLRLMHTKNLRQYEGGFLDIGHSVNPFMMIAPHSKNWVTLGHCSSKCTGEILPPEGIKVLGGTLHSHLIGTSMKVQHIRDGKEMAPILIDEHYDFNYQQERMLRNETTILPKDHLIINCHYNSEKRDKPTYGGLSSQEEMCLAFLMYYPRIPFLACHSTVDYEDLYKQVGIEEIYGEDSEDKQSLDEMDTASIEAAQLQALVKQEQDPTKNAIDLKFYGILNWFIIKEPLVYQNKSVLDVLMSNELWEDGTVAQKLQTLYEKGNYKQRCLMTGQARKSQSGDGVLEAPPQYEPYITEDECTAKEK